MRARLAHAPRSASGRVPNYDGGVTPRVRGADRAAAAARGRAAAVRPAAPAPAGRPPTARRRGRTRSRTRRRAADDGPAPRDRTRPVRRLAAARHVLDRADRRDARQPRLRRAEPHDQGTSRARRRGHLRPRPAASARSARRRPPAARSCSRTGSSTAPSPWPTRRPARPPRIAVACRSGRRDDDAAAGLRGAPRGRRSRGAARLSPRAPPADAAAHAVSADVFDERALGGAPALGRARAAPRSPSTRARPAAPPRRVGRTRRRRGRARATGRSSRGGVCRRRRRGSGERRVCARLCGARRRRARRARQRRAAVIRVQRGPYSA